MAKKTPTSFIPYQNHHIIPAYAMTSSFSEQKAGLSIISDKYENYLNNLISGREIPNQKAIGRAMGVLQSLVAQEKAAELAFLADLEILGIDVEGNTEATWRNLIESFNLIFSTEAVFSRNISLLKQTEATEGKQLHQDITRFFQETYLPKAIAEFTPIKSIEDITDKLLLKIMRRAVELMLQGEGDSKASKAKIEAYKEIWGALQKLTYRNDLFKNLLSLFNLKDFLTNNLDLVNNTTDYSKFHISATQQNSAGLVYEEMEAAVLKRFAKMGKITNSSGMFQMNIEVIQTGATKQKTDNMIVMSEGKIDVSSMTKGSQRKDDSIRLRSIERIDELLKKIGNKKANLVFISDKNYILGANTRHSQYGGFGAETPTLNSLSNYGAQFHIPNITGMIEYLASAGEGMIVNDIESCMRVIETCIANFLFDDLQIEGPPDMNVNRVHLLSLSGVYIPASVYLEAAYRGLRGIGNLSADEVVNATFEPTYSDPGKGTKEAWDAFVQKRKKEHIHIVFMGGYTKFINDLFS